MKNPKAKRNTQPEEKNWRREKYRKELATSVYDKHRMNIELKYEGRAEGFLHVPDELTYSGNHLSDGEKMTWLSIFSHNWDADPTYRVSWPGRKRLAIILGRSERQVGDYIKGLKEKGILLMRQRVDRTALYLLLDPPKEWMEETKRKLEESKEEKDQEEDSNRQDRKNPST